jgi:hypothetical protein
MGDVQPLDVYARGGLVGAVYQFSRHRLDRNALSRNEAIARPRINANLRMKKQNLPQINGRLSSVRPSESGISFVSIGVIGGPTG